MHIDMNIFVTDPDPIKSAINLDALRVNKMIIESAALLANAMAHYGAKVQDLPIAISTGQPYKTTAWQNHPCCLWVKASKSNYLWLLSHMHALIDVKQIHTGVLHSAYANIPRLHRGANLIPDGPLTEFVNCTPYKSMGDVIMAYKITLSEKWRNDKRPPKWLHKPDWFTD